jgi:hypothetical protein
MQARLGSGSKARKGSNAGKKRLKDRQDRIEGSQGRLQRQARKKMQMEPRKNAKAGKKKDAKVGRKSRKGRQEKTQDKMQRKAKSDSKAG